MTGLEERMRQKLESALAPVVLDIVNESALHKGHAGDNGSGESHFRITVVSEKFQNLGRVERQRAVYAALAEEFSGSLHALALITRTPDEYSGK